ncbi:MAG: hypothetical protein ACHQM6_04425, partial [Candidatus Kapaibacterium sp.]
SGKDSNIYYESLKLSAYYWFSRKMNIGAALPLNRQRSKYGMMQGLGDVLIVFDYLVNDHPGDLTVSGENSFLVGKFEATSVQIGGKFATGTVNQDNISLQYQNGLGTNDFLVGIIYSAANPQENDYDLFVGGFTLQIPFGIAGNKYDSLRRGIDLLGRMSYQYPILHKFGIKGEFMAIQRLTKSKLYQASTVTEISDNDLQLNISAAATYKYQEDIFFETGFSIPLIERKINYDGLKREYTLFASANYHFR